MRLPNVVATAIGYYRIRIGDSRPGVEPVVRGTGERTFTNSEIRDYSWPAVLVIVSQWQAATEFGGDGSYSPDQIVPKTLYLKDGRRVPVCVIEGPREPRSQATPPDRPHPLNNIGCGQPLLVSVQQRQHMATIACLVDDGHKVYALTNRHVTGEAGEVIRSPLGGRPREIGQSAGLQLTRLPFEHVYDGWPGDGTYVNLDIGLVEIDDLNQWTAKLPKHPAYRNGRIMGQLIDLSSTTFPLQLVGQNVCGWGASSGLMQGEIQGLFYRYKSRGGFEYIADFLIGPRAAVQGRHAHAFATHPGDSGTLWLLEAGAGAKQWIDGLPVREPLRPLAVQWGANRLYSALTSAPQSYALATCLSIACDLLDVDVIRDWNLDQPDTWGAVGHFSIAAGVADRLTLAPLKELMRNNLEIISHKDDVILSSEFKNMGSDAFVPLADVPDFFWKHGKQGHSRPFEGPNHFADMDHRRDSDGKDLLDLCADPANIDADIWNGFYDALRDLSTGQPIEQKYRGLLPFRVWQIFDAMVEFARNEEDLPKFVCAAGVLAHYVGDACQPLHISYLHDGDPLNGHPHTVHHRDGTTSDVVIPAGKGVHSAYEDGMINSHRQDILDGIAQTPAVDPNAYIQSGKAAAAATIELMRQTFTAIPPASIVAAYVALTDKRDSDSQLWEAFGTGTIKAMQDSVHLLAQLWESAWVRGGAPDRQTSVVALGQQQAMDICADANFLPSLSIASIGAVLDKTAAGGTA
ncbi:hypothetical protein [Labrys neptuniae]